APRRAAVLARAADGGRARPPARGLGALRGRDRRAHPRRRARGRRDAAPDPLAMPHPRPPLPPGPWLVVGLARSGIAAGRALAARREEVVGVDAGHPPGEPGFPVRLGTDGLAELARAGVVVKSPGVPRETPVVAAARARGVPVLGELELAWRLLDTQPWVVVTGTNGKTTTTE